MNQVKVTDYNPAWAKEFVTLKGIFERLLASYNVKVEHVGSTSVEGLAAKPILDIDIIMKEKEDLPAIIKALEKVGYRHVGDLGIEGREAFKRIDEKVPYVEGEAYTFEHNLYVCEASSLALKNHLLFKAYIQAHPNALEAYATLKRRLAIQYAGDIDAYCEAKTDFITDILAKAGLVLSEVEYISHQNRLD